jgi:hypothetical protein
VRKLFLLLLFIFAVFVFINSNAHVGAEKAARVESTAKAIVEP